MARVTIEFDTNIPEDVESIKEVLGLEPTPAGSIPPSAFAPMPLPPIPSLGTPKQGLTQEDLAKGVYDTVPPVPEAPSSVPPAPPVPEALAAAPATPVELDSEGLPWDARIHTTAKTYRQSDNTWKLKRKIPDATVAAVKAELRQATPASSVPAKPSDPLAGAATQPPVAPPAGVPSGQPEYQQLMQLVSAAIVEGRLVKPDVERACTNAGLAFIPDLATNLELVPQVAAELGIVLC